MKRVLWASYCVIFFAWVATARAAAPPDVTAFVRAVGNEMPAVLAGTHSIEDRRARLMPFVARVVDVPAVAEYCMGRYWKRATTDQKEVLQSLFLTVVVNVIATWTAEHRGFGIAARVEMDPPILKEDGTYVPTRVQVGEAPVLNVVWVVNMQAQPPRLLDVVTGGISVRAVERSDFVGYLDRNSGDIDGLIDVLRKRARDTGGLPEATASFKAAPQ